MRKISSFADVQIVINELLSERDRKRNSNTDRRGYQIKNTGAATDDTDVVILKQLKAAIAAIPIINPAPPPPARLIVQSVFREGRASGGVSLSDSNWHDIPGTLVTLDKIGVWSIDGYFLLSGDPAAGGLLGGLTFNNIDFTAGFYASYQPQVSGEVLTISMGWILSVPAAGDAKLRVKANLAGSLAHLYTNSTKLRAIYLGS